MGKEQNKGKITDHPLWKAVAKRIHRLSINPLFLLTLTLLGWFAFACAWYWLERGKPVSATVDGQTVQLDYSTDGKRIEVYKDYVLIAEHQKSDLAFPLYLRAYKDNNKDLLDYLTSKNLQILLAVIAGLIVTPVLALRQARANSIAKFRQEWIKEIREIVSQAATCAVEIQLLWGLYERPHNFDKQDELYKGITEKHLKMVYYYYQFRLYMNPKESQHRQWSNHLCHLKNLLDDYINDRTLSDEIDQIIATLVDYTQKQLKREWDVTKDLR